MEASLHNLQFRPWLTFWGHPRATVRQGLVDAGPRQLLPIVLLFAAVNLLNDLQGGNMYPEVESHLLRVLLVLLSAVLVALTFVYLLPWLLAVTARWFDGVGSFRDNQVAVILPLIPTSVGMLLGVLADMAGSGTGMGFTVGFLIPIGMIFGLGFLVYLGIVACRALAEAQGYSAWRAAVHYLLIWVVLIGVISTVAMGILRLRGDL